MPGEQTNVENKESTEGQQSININMESVNRIAKLPVVETTINAASNMYEKVKDSNQYINIALSTAENTVHTAVEKVTPIAAPVAARLEGPIRKVDGILCSGLDFVEEKVPCVKLPPNEMLTNTKNYINDTMTPAVQTVQGLKDTCVNKVGEYLGKKDSCSTEEAPKKDI